MKNIHIIAALLALSITLAFGAQPPDQEKLDKVTTGELKEAHASWWGFNEDDATDILTSALNSNAETIVIDKMPSPWIVAKTLGIPSDIEIVFEEGAVLQAKRGCFKGKGEVLIQISRAENITLRGLGKGATIKMFKADYHTDAYEPSEWRHAISILSSTNITIQNLKLKDSGGDGLYFGMSQKDRPPTKITVKDVICDGHNRQGLSVIAGVDCLVENCKFINTRGTPPAAGVDFEPNFPGEPIRGFVMRNCDSENNQGCGYLFALHNMDSTSGPLEITMEKCTSRKEEQSAFSFHTNNGPDYDRPGLVLVKDCLFADNPAPIYLNGTSSNGFKMQFEDVRIRNIAKNNPDAPIFIAGLNGRCEGAAGNLHFKNTKVYDRKERKLFQFNNGGCVGGLDNVSGKITGYINGKKTNEFTLSSKWARKNYPTRKIHRIPYLASEDTAFQRVPGTAKATGTAFDNIRLRGTGTWNILAKKGDTLKLSAEFGRLAHYKCPPADVKLKTPSGQNINVGIIPFEETESFQVDDLPEDGLYTLTIAAQSCWARVADCNLPVVIPMPKLAPNFCSGTGVAYFYVPKGTKEFGVRFFGDGTESLKATVYSPGGKELWSKDDIMQLEQFIGNGKLAQKGGVFKIKIDTASHHKCIEDYFIRLDGIPSFLALSPRMLIQPAPLQAAPQE